MTLNQLQHIKRWQVDHKRDHPIEYQTYDLVLTAWVLGWIGMPAALILGNFLTVLVCVGLCFAPDLYIGWRRRLHREGRLRCDWIQK